MIRVRVDDFPHTSKREPQHTLAAFLAFDRTLREGTGHRRYLLGVVPGQCTPEDLLFLDRQLNVVVGMHGTDHDEQRLDRNGGNQFEHYLGHKQIAQVLYDHRQALRGATRQPVGIYMPPRNVLSFQVVRALDDAGFQMWTSGPETADLWKVGPRAIYSEAPHEYGRSDELLTRESHVVLREAARIREVVLTLHWTWEVNIGLEHLERFLKEIPRDLFADFDG